jgi:hypothetical protein
MQLGRVLQQLRGTIVVCATYAALCILQQLRYRTGCAASAAHTSVEHLTQMVGQIIGGSGKHWRLLLLMAASYYPFTDKSFCSWWDLRRPL